MRTPERKPRQWYLAQEDDAAGEEEEGGGRAGEAGGAAGGRDAADGRGEEERPEPRCHLQPDRRGQAVACVVPARPVRQRRGSRGEMRRPRCRRG